VSRKMMLMLSVFLGLFIAAAGGWAQAPDGEMPPPPPPPGGGRFLFMRGEFSFENRLKPITGAPFSAQATTETTQVLADGNQIKHTEAGQVYRDSLGRTRRDTTIDHIGPWSTATTPRRIVNITDPVAGANYLLDATEKTVHERTASGAWLGPESRKFLGPRSKGDSNVQRTTESLGTEVMAGVSVQGTRTTETIPAGAVGNQNPIVIVSERWTSPDLQTVVYSKHTDPRFGTTIYQLTNINRQEPDAALFQIPSDYTVKEGPMGKLRKRE
jgi:hypothetical protein